jgi:uncharacterized protein (TIGR04552 family)
MSPRDSTTSAFLPARPDATTIDDLHLQDVHEIRLLLTGDSVVDWHRLNLETPEDVRRLLRVNSIDIDNPDDLARLQSLRGQAVHYLTERLGLKVDDVIATQTSVLELPLLASGRGRLQRQACVLLKVMHIIYHLDARELRTLLSIPDNTLYELVERSVMTLFDELRKSGVPVVEFSWSRKTTDSLITKLLVKRETSAARVFDRLRFRVVVERHDDLIPTLHVMLTRFIPFNYVVPGQTVNSLVDPALLERRQNGIPEVGTVPSLARDTPNEFSGSGYQVLNFVVDLPVRVDALLGDEERAARSGNVVFVLVEFQVMDRGQALANEQGENSHSAYKLRQHQRVRERLLRGPRKNADATEGDLDSGTRSLVERGGRLGASERSGAMPPTDPSDGNPSGKR